MKRSHDEHRGQEYRLCGGKCLNLFYLLQYWYYCILNSSYSVRLKMGLYQCSEETLPLYELFHCLDSVTMVLIMLLTSLRLLELDKNTNVLLKVKRRVEIRGEQRW